MSDNFELTVAADRKLKEALELACTDYRNAKGFVKTKDKLVFYWLAENNEATPLPVPMSGEELVPIVVKWLKEEAEYPEEPDIDGSCRRGFRITTEGCSSGWSYIMFQVLPEWILYHK